MINLSFLMCFTLVNGMFFYLLPYKTFLTNGPFVDEEPPFQLLKPPCFFQFANTFFLISCLPLSFERVFHCKLKDMSTIQDSCVIISFETQTTLRHVFIV